MSSVNKPRSAKRFSSTILKDFSPTKWSSYFENQKEIFIENDIFNIYSSGTEGTGPVLFMIHGGGYSALTWALFSKAITKKIDCQICAIDLRGHGNTKTEDENNLSLEILVKDVVTTIGVLFSKMTPIVLIGHSLGGSIAVSAALVLPNVIGICVIDVVEGTALEALPSMRNILRNRPSTFQTIEEAIQWSVKHGQTLNLEAARVSMPGQIKNMLSNELAANQSDSTVDGTENQAKIIKCQFADTLMEEEEEEEQDKFDTHKDKKKSRSGNNLYTWRIDLKKTEPFWDNWFTGLSKKFLDVGVPKILLLANINRLDTALTVGQMQGKFQLQVLSQSGHAIHESQPQRVADVIARFLQTQRLALAKNDTSL